MEMVKIDRTELSMSRFVFGTASLFNVGSAPKRQRLLHAAVAAGFTHFDTAPYYGFGIAERDLALVLKSHPQVTLTTKVGLYSPGGEDQPHASIFVRKAAGRLFRSLSRPERDFAIARAQTALEGSLRRTGRDTIDLYTLHEPTKDLMAVEEWCRWLEQCVSSGKVRWFGVALTADRLVPFLESDCELCQVIQVLDSIEKREADILQFQNRPMQITYGYVSSGLRSHPNASVTDILKHALRRNSTGAIIVSSKHVERLPQYARLFDEGAE
jgi:aryl-alcohol dehydrogenase-like predicted oxidoreductase